MWKWPLLSHNNKPIIKIYAACQQQCSYPCDDCRFAPCICDYIIELDSETGYWIVDD